VTRRLKAAGILLAMAIFASGCAASKAFKQGESAVRSGNLDEAVVAYRRAVQVDPRNPNYAIALQRTMVAASRAHAGITSWIGQPGVVSVIVIATVPSSIVTP